MITHPIEGRRVSSISVEKRNQLRRKHKSSLKSAEDLEKRTEELNKFMEIR